MLYVSLECSIFQHEHNIYILAITRITNIEFIKQKHKKNMDSYHNILSNLTFILKKDDNLE